jgi:hypothetical protein
MIKAPWQYEWKRPKLEELEAHNDLESDEARDVTAALVSRDEVSGVTPSSSEDSSFLLSVALYGGQKGNRIRLRLSNPPSFESIQMKELRWPGSMFDRQEEIVSVELCRSSSEYTSTSAADALDVLNLMSLGNNLEELKIISHGDITDSKREPTRSSSTEKPNEDLKSHQDLLLACLSSSGRIYLYKALELLQTPSFESDDEVELGVASLFLGQDIYQQIREALLPLSKPYAIVNLSVPLVQPKKKLKGWTLMPPFFKEQEGLDIHPWDGSLWNSTVEKSTAVHRTLNNVPSHAVATFGYVAVYGSGTRVRRVQRTRAPDNVVVVEGMEALADEELNSFLEEKNVVGKGADNALEAKSAEDSQPWWKGSDKAKVHEVIEGQLETGGFITFVDLQHSSESRTMYLPFSPKSIYPVFWGEMALVIVLSDETTLTNCAARALAIRIDTSDKNFVDCGFNPALPRQHDVSNFSVADETIRKTGTCDVRRFTLIPIVLPVEDQFLAAGTSVIAVSGSSLTVSPPNIVLIYFSQQNQDTYNAAVTLNEFQCFDLLGPNEDVGFSKNKDHVVVIRTTQGVGRTARIPHLVMEAAKSTCWSRGFQGCSLLRLASCRYFICWDGASDDTGAFVQELMSDEEGIDLVSRPSSILPLHVPRAGKSLISDELYVETSVEEPSERDVGLPFTGAENSEGVFVPQPGTTTMITDEIVIDALDSISSLSYRGAESIFSPRRTAKAKRTQRLSYTEKSERLVKDLNSWSVLDNSKENRAIFEPQVPVLLEFTGKSVLQLSLRLRFVNNGHATPFQQVLGWLCQSEDYYAAACIALGLLRDTETLQYLRSQQSMAGGNVECSDSEGLLDGIVPLYPLGSLSMRPRPSAITQVADMAIGCLAKGGLSMSAALDAFLVRNSDYNPSRAVLMLVAIATRCVSREESIVSLAMGNGYTLSDLSDPGDLLWPVRSLLRVGVARNLLAQVIVLVNAAMPDELRCRETSENVASSKPPISLCKALIADILASSPGAAPLLLGLIDEETRKRFWDSLSGEIRLQFSLVNVQENCPLLRQADVRNWALESLDDCIRKEAPPSAIDLSNQMPTEWLQRLCEACLSNGHCEYGRILTFGVDNSEVDDDEGTNRYISEFENAVEALKASPASGGLDFDLIIPALLILEQREMTWNEEAVITTQRLLDASCYLAGRPGPTLFSLDASRLMQQCAAADNVAAAAFLAGGKNGLVLSCCDILVRQGLDMDQAENFLVSGSATVLASRRGDTSDPFEVTNRHHAVLWLLTEHVLSVRTFGEFSPSYRRGKVDPVFAARVCLRTWLFLSKSKQSTPWLVGWLRKRLQMSDEQTSSKRLSCAALTRALMWPTGPDEAETLATTLGVENIFLIQLALSCQGLMESVPPAMAEEIITQSDSATSTVKGENSSYSAVHV